MKKLLLSGLLLMLGYCSWGRGTTIIGRVISASDLSALEGTTVAISGSPLYALCDSTGHFSLAGIEEGKQVVAVFLLGHEKVMREIDAREGDTISMGTIALEEIPYDINSIVISAEAPISVQKGDTTQFNADAFMTNPDADADELLAKMPGVVIQDGKIESQGEPIRRVYVDGRLFFESDPMAALKSLPADAVQSIQIFDDKTDQARLTGFDDGEAIKAINIVTRGKAKTTTIFKSELSGGRDLTVDPLTRYLGGGNFSYFNDKHRVTVTGLHNNINTSRFSQTEESGDLDENGNLRLQPEGIRKTTNFGLNYSYTANKLKGSVNYTYADNKTISDKFRQRTYSTNAQDEMTDIYSTSSNISHRASARIEWKIDPKTTLTLSPQMTIGSSDDHTLELRRSYKDGEMFSTRKESQPKTGERYSHTGSVAFSRRLAVPGQSITASATYNFSNNESDIYRYYDYNYQWKDNVRYLNEDETEYRAGGWYVADTLSRWTTNVSPNNMVSSRITYTQPLSAEHRLSFNVTGSRNWSKNNKQVYRFKIADNDFTNKLANQSSYIDLDYTDYGGGMGYVFTKKSVVLTANLNYVRLEQRREQFDPKPKGDPVVQQYFNNVQPMVSLKYSFAQKTYLQVTYSGQKRIPNLQNMMSGFDDSNANNIRIGNPGLLPGYEHNIRAFYTTSNPGKSRNFMLTLTARTTSNFVTTKTSSGLNYILPDGTLLQNKNAQIVEYLNLNGYLYGQVNATYAFAVRPIKSNVNVQLSHNYTKVPSLYGVVNFSHTNRTTLSLGVTSNISPQIDFNIYSRSMYTNTNNTVRKNTSNFNQKLTVSANIIFWKDMVFNTVSSWEYNENHIGSEKNLAGVNTKQSDRYESFFLVNVSLGKKFLPKKNLELNVTVKDLLGQNKSIQYSVYARYTDYAQANLLGRHMMVRLMYRFNSLSHGKKKEGVDGAENARSISADQLRRIQNGQSGQSGQGAGANKQGAAANQQGAAANQQGAGANKQGSGADVRQGDDATSDNAKTGASVK